MEAVSFRACIVRVSRHPGNRAGFAPQIGLLPIRWHADGFEEYYLSTELARSFRNQSLQFAEAPCTPSPEAKCGSSVAENWTVPVPFPIIYGSLHSRRKELQFSYQ